MKITSVVVTYNRLDLLKECITALINQTRKLDEIIVVNNNSADGTKEWLDDQEDLTIIHQENLGGAGGFHTGIKVAYEKGYDWIWCMDDDCLPKTNALEKLFAKDFEQNVVLNSTVVTKSHPNKLNFGLYVTKENKLYNTYNEIKNKKIINSANFFNGTLLSRNIIKKIGYPNPYFFIYGDEYEYYLRIQSNSISIITIVDSIVEHPQQKYINFGKGKLSHRFNYVTKIRATYFPRNLVLIFSLYKEFRLKRLIKNIFLDIFYILIYQKELKIACIYIKSFFQGVLTAIFQREKYDYRITSSL